MASTISASTTSGSDFDSGPHRVKSNLTRKAFCEGGHHLEKLEFALAVAETRGDHLRAASLRSEIAAMGGNIEEPGT